MGLGQNILLWGSELCKYILEVNPPDHNKSVILTKLVFEVWISLKDSLVNYIIDEKTAEEDRYTDKFRDSFNLYGRKYGLHVSDQTHRGMTGNKLKNHREGVGGLDLFFSRNDLPWGIAEALKLSSCNRNNIRLHIDKVFGYNTHKCETNFIFIYGNSDKPKELWESYCDYVSNGFLESTSIPCLKCIDSGEPWNLERFK